MDREEERSLRLYGTTSPVASHRTLRAGPLAARLEDGNLRYVTFGGEEVLRAIAYVIRDRDWGTYQPLIENLVVEENDRRFRAAYDGTCRSGPATLRFHAEIVGEAEGRLAFTVDATPDAPFETNRCGFTILHPLEVAGEPVAVEHTDGTIERTVFPALIEPWQPFKEIRALTHRPGDRFEAACRLEGDSFEMEDQRNWSDASFKTYVRPIERPWPYVLPAGEANRQSVGLTISGGLARAASRSVAAAALRHATVRLYEAAGHALPPIGVVVAPEEIEQAVAERDRLAELGPQIILCHYDPTAGHGDTAIERFAALQRACPVDYALECVVGGSGDVREELQGVADAVAAVGLALSSIAVCPSVDRQSTPPGSTWPGCPPLEEVYRAARAAFPGVPLGGGMFSYFTELNRKRPPVELLDFVTHATNPIVHAADDESVMETLSTLPHITRSTRAFIGGKAYRIGPSTIGMRQNPYGSRTMPNPKRERLCMAAEDPRQDGLFAAAWTIGYAAAAAPAGLDLLVPAAFCGPRGVLREGGEGGRRPVFHAVRWLAENAGAAARSAHSVDPRLGVLSGTKNGQTVVLLANLGKEACRVTIEGGGPVLHARIVDGERLDGTTMTMQEPDLTLDVFAIARIVCEGA